ncbi:MAG: hypothetical protein ABIL09_09780 [Gemmatimonadota bacterium]
MAAAVVAEHLGGAGEAIPAYERLLAGIPGHPGAAARLAELRGAARP